MRLLVSLCLASGLLAREAPRPEAPLPGRDQAFLAKILQDPEGGAQPWRCYRAPAYSASAVVEVVGELTKEELRQATFQEFLTWFRADLRRFFQRHGGAAIPGASLASATLPVARYGGNPLPRPVPLGRVDF
jgi:hypothetical protein